MDADRDSDPRRIVNIQAKNAPPIEQKQCTQQRGTEMSNHNIPHRTIPAGVLNKTSSNKKQRDIRASFTTLSQPKATTRAPAEISGDLG